MSIVFYPLLGTITELSLVLRFIFFTGLMFIYTDLSSAAPFPSNIEGFVYMKDRYLKKSVLWKIQAEMIIYSLIFASLLSIIAF